MGFSFQVRMSLRGAVLSDEAISVFSVYACREGVVTLPEEHRRLATTSFGGFNQNGS
jgi:hypothetical protein